jgi:predicted metal-dependent hydrolase
MNTYTKDGQTITYHIIRKSNKNAYFRIKDGVLVVTANILTSKKAIESFIDLKFDVFYEKINRDKFVEPTDQITLWGKTYHLDQFYGNFSYHIEDDHVTVRSRSDDVVSIKKKIYLSELNKQVLIKHEEILPVLRSVGLNILPIKIKYLKSKFGSYHRKHHEITLNSFLATLDPIYLAYVMFHEYAHVLVFNHSKDFYNLLDKLMPNHKVYQKDLKKIAIP